MAKESSIIQQVTSSEYKEGFVTDVEQEFLPKGLSEDIVRQISARMKQHGRDFSQKSQEMKARKRAMRQKARARSGD